MKRMHLSPEEAESLRQAIGKESYADYLYTQHILGLCNKDFLSLKRDGIILEGHTLLIKESGRHCTLTPDAQETLERRLDQPGTDLLFPRPRIRRGVWMGWTSITPEYYRKNIVRPLLRTLGIPEDRIIY